MDKQAQQETRQTQVIQPQEKLAQHARLSGMDQSPARAMAILRQGGSLTCLCPQDAMALGTYIGNNAMENLLKSRQAEIAIQPLRYTPLVEPLQPAPIQAGLPDLQDVTGIVGEPSGLQPFPSVGLHMPDGGAAGWLGGIHE